MRLFERYALIVFGIAILSGMAIVALSLVSLMHSIDLDEAVTENRQRLLLLEQTESKLFETESAVRAYALTGDPAFSDAFVSARNELEAHLRKLDASNFTAGSEAGTVDTLIDLIRQRIQGMDELASLRREQGVAAVAEKIASHEGKTLTDRVLAIGDGITSQEITLLEDRRREEQASARTLLYLFVAGTLTTLALLGTAFIITLRGRRQSERLVKHLEQTTREVTLMSRLNHSLQSCQTHEEAAEVIRHYLRLLFPGVSGGLYLMRSSRNLLQLSTTWDTDSPEEAFMDPIEPQDCWALRLGKSLKISGDVSDMQCNHTSLTGQGGYLCVPMMAQGEIIGLLHLRTTTTADMNELLTHAETLASPIGAAVASITLRQALRQQNVRDPLTNLYNRRYLEETMEREQLRAQRNRASIGLVMLDLDHFKQLNDNTATKPATQC